jgi:hypothetical protein
MQRSKPKLSAMKKVRGLEPSDRGWVIMRLEVSHEFLDEFGVKLQVIVSDFCTTL